MAPYRAWINQPSSLQPLHSMNGVRCLVTSHQEDMATIYFVDGPVISMVVPRLSISRAFN